MAVCGSSLTARRLPLHVGKDRAFPLFSKATRILISKAELSQIKASRGLSNKGGGAILIKNVPLVPTAMLCEEANPKVPTTTYPASISSAYSYKAMMSSRESLVSSLNTKASTKVIVGSRVLPVDTDFSKS